MLKNLKNDAKHLIIYLVIILAFSLSIFIFFLKYVSHTKETKIAGEAKIAREGYKTKTLIANLKIFNLNTVNEYNHLAILDENDKEIRFVACAPQKGTYIINLDLEDKKVTENLILPHEENILQYHDVLVTSTKKIYISYSKKDQIKNVSLVVAEIIKTTNTYNVKPIYKSNSAEPPYGYDQAGGKMIEFDQDHIMIALGDYQNPYLFNKKNNDLGKTILININSFSKKTFSTGHRNPEGLVFSKSFNKIFETEHGPEGGDEINHIQINKNYGWPTNTYGTIYREIDSSMNFNDPSKQLWSNVGGANFGNHDDYTKPVYAYIPSIGIKAIEQLPETQYLFPKWKNDFIVCSSKGLHRVKINNSNEPRVLFSEQMGIFRSFNQINKSDVLEGCRDIAISENGIIFTNDFRMIIND
jgi:hypothetical protein